MAERLLTDSSLASAIAERTGRSVDELEVQVAAAAFAGGLLAALRHWRAEGCTRPLGELLDRTLATLREGLEVSLGRDGR